MKITTTLITFLFVILSTSIFAQEIKKEAKTVETKIDVFTSKTGIITKFTDSKLTALKLSYGEVAGTRIRKISIGPVSSYFYQIEKERSTASIEYSDLLEVIKALKTLKDEAEKDAATNPDYLEDKFVTVDGFQVGYYVSKGKVSWYLKLEKYGSDNTLFIGSAEIIESAFNEAKVKIEELKKQP